MHDRLDTVLGEEPGHQGVIADVPDDEFARGHGLAKAAAEVIQHDDALCGCPQLLYNMAADIAGAAGDENRGLGQRISLSFKPLILL